MDVHEKFEKARRTLVLEHPFFGSLLLTKLKIVEDDTCRTASVNGETLRWSPKFFDSLSIKETTGVIAHEVMHCALLHHHRRGYRDSGRWNESCDYAINPLLIEEGFTLPEGALISPDYEGLSAEEIYSHLDPPKPEPEPEEEEEGEGEGGEDGEDGEGEGEDGEGKGEGAGEGAGASATGVLLDSPQQDQAGAAQDEDDWRVSSALARNIESGKAGADTGAASQAVANEHSNRVDWREALRDFFDALGKDDFSWTRPNKRMYPLIIPSTESEGDLDHLVIAIDTSGSVSDKVLDIFFTEIDSILEDFGAKVTVIQCDSSIKSIEEYQAGDALERVAEGRGGTRFNPVFEHMVEEDITASALVYLTDMESSPPAKGFRIECPVLWASTANFDTGTGLPDDWEEYAAEKSQGDYVFRDCTDDTVIWVDCR